VAVAVVVGLVAISAISGHLFGVDRAFESLLATLDDPAADLRAYATAFDRLADAAEQGEPMDQIVSGCPRDRISRRSDRGDPRPRDRAERFDQALA
jgi:hypothetical protein